MRQSFLLLRRDKIFLPAVVAGVLVTMFANLASDWGIEEFRKILFDIGALGFHLTGCLVATFWGTKTISEARSDGSLEIQLAAPVSRVSWLVGKYMGLVMGLVLLWILTVIFWQAIMLANNFGLMEKPQLMFFAFQLIEWALVGAVAVFYSTFAGVTIALFATISTWLAGLVSFPISQNLPPFADGLSVAVVKWLARVWDLRQFNLTSYATNLETISAGELQVRAGYGITLIFLIITVSCIFFRRRDVMA
jgi:ABC-type transport system involved in multi-copper enzyme maturation permease subunit